MLCCAALQEQKGDSCFPWPEVSNKFISANLKQKEYSSGRKTKRSQKSTQAINHQSHHRCWESGTEEHNHKNMHFIYKLTF